MSRSRSEVTWFLKYTRKLFISLNSSTVVQQCSPPSGDQFSVTSDRASTQVSTDSYLYSIVYLVHFIPCSDTASFPILLLWPH